MDPNQARYQTSPHPDAVSLSIIFSFLRSVKRNIASFLGIDWGYPSNRTGRGIYVQPVHTGGASEETGRAGRRTGKQEESGRRERVRLVQLLACLALFLTVFIGKGVFPQRLDQLGEDILALIGSNTDFRAAFSDLGESLAEQDSVLGDIGEFCIQVFGSGQDSGGEASPALAGPRPIPIPP